MKNLKRVNLFILLFPFYLNAQVNLQQGLLAYYPFTGNANDSSGNGKHGTVNNATLANDRCGKSNSAYSFNGTNAYIEIPVGTLQTQYYSYSVWVNAAVIPSSGNYTYPFAIGASGVGQNIAINNNAMTGWAAGTTNNGTPTVSLVAQGCQVTTNVWYHVVLIRDTSKIRLYVNGSLNLHEISYGSSNTSTGSNNPVYGSSPKALIGNRDLSSSFYFKGLIDDVRVYGRVITPDEVDSLYNEKPCFFNGNSPNHIAQYNFSGNANDSKGGHHGTVSGASLTTDRFGNSNSAYSFTAASSNYISIPPCPFLLDNYSYSVWVKPASAPASGGAFIFLSVGSNADQNMQIENNQNNGALGYLTGFTLTAYSKSGSTVTTGGVASGTLPANNTWYHVVCTRDNNYFRVYVNGCLMSTSASTSGALPYYGTSTLAGRIGARQSGSKYFNGALDDVGIYASVLNATEIARMYNDGKPFLVSKDTTMCENVFKPYKLKASKGYCSYKWIDITKRSTVLGTDSQLLISINKTTTFRVFNHIGDSATVKVTILPKPVLNIGKDTAYCGNFSRTLNAQNPGLTFLWNTSSASQTISVNSKGWFGVKVTNSNGCFSTDSIFIDKHPLPVINLGNDTLICNSFSKILDARNTSAKILWKSGDTTSQLTVKSKGTYSVKVVDSFGCINHDTIMIKNPVVKARFILSDSALCLHTNTFSMKDTSKYTDDAWKKSTFYFGDGTNKQDTVAKKAYSDTGKYFLRLVVESREKCKDSFTRNIILHPGVKIGFGISKAQQCFNGHGFNFSNTSSISKGTVAYAWSFGDDSTSGLKDIVAKKYLKDSTYTVRLISTSDKNCRDTISKSITVFPSSKVVFTPSVFSQCQKGNSTDFVNTSTIRTGIISTFTWSFGDNTSSSQKGITGKSYSSADSFKVMLLTISDKGCRDSLTKSVYVWANSNPGFSINKPVQCFNGHVFNFVNTSTISKGSMNYEWLFGDNSSGISKDVTGKTYNKDSSYTIRLMTTSDRNCKDTIDKAIILNPNTSIGFAPSKTSQCFNYHSVNFINSSKVRTGSIATYSWKLGDISTASTRDVLNKRYNIADSFKVYLLTLTDKGCRDSIEKSIYIWPNTLIGFGISKDTQCFEWHRFNFTNTSTLQAGTIAYDWQMGDATSDTSRNIISKRYAQYGSYQVRLHTTTDRSCKDTMVKQVIVHASPIAKFAIDKDRQCYRANIFSFSNQTTINNGSIITYDWNMDNGQQKNTLHVPNYSYTTEDSFDVRLIALSDRGCYDTVNHMAVTFAQPVAKYQVPNDSQCWQKHYFVIINQTTLKYGTMTHNWDFGDKTSDNSYTPATKSYANKSAKYTIRYKVSSDHGCTDSMNHNINLLERPISEFDINDSVQCFRGHLFSFINKTTFSALNTLSYFWDYGNGSTSTGITPNTATYPSAQYYPVQLSSYSYLTNCYDTVIYNVLPAPHGVPAFLIDKDSQCLRFNQYGFTNKSTLSFGNMTYKWDFKDGTKSTLKDPSKHYVSGNSYSVKMVATTNHNCSDSIEKSIILIPHPKAGFAVNDTSQCLNGHGFDLTNTTTLAYGTYTSMWLFDDATNNASKDVNAKTFSSPYSHKIILTVNSKHGCTDTTQRFVHLEKPNSTQVQLTENDSQCLKGNRFSFSSTSSDPAVIHSSHKWEFGDGSTSSTNPASHKYISDGKLKILLETLSANGCRDTAYFDVVVHPQPVSSFTSNDPCFADSVVFTNTSGISSGSITNSHWDFGDGATSTLVSPFRYYAIPKKYDITLVSTSGYGCRDTLLKKDGAWLREKPDARFGFKRLADKEFEVSVLQFQNLSSSDVKTFHWNFGNGNTSSESDPLAEMRDSSTKTISLIVTNNDGCTDTFSMKTGSLISDFVFFLPNAFSPDGNEKNEVYKPIGTPYVFSYEMAIFNMWGEKMFETKDITQGWDGRYKGEICPQGVYIVRVYLVPLRGDLQHHELTMTLLR
jgi:gliding motility-associated-like protein